MSGTKKKKTGFLYAKEVVVWVLLVAFFAGLIIFNKDRIFKKDKDTEKTSEAETEPGIFDEDWLNQSDSEPEETEPSETEPAEPTVEHTQALAVAEGSGPLRVYFLDVGEGDAAILTLNGQAMVIDGGDAEHAGVLVNWLANLGIGRVDYMISTHPHKDHVGGLPSVYSQAAVGRLYTPVTEYAENAEFSRLMTLAHENGTEVRVPQAGETFDFAGAEVRFLGPTRFDPDEMNNNSLVVRVRFGDNSFLFTGDAEVNEEADILSAGYDVHAEILKVSHHGSEYATSVAFANAVGAKECIISVGANEYGHPSANVLQRLIDAGGMVYETMVSGTVTVTASGTGYTMNFER